MKEIILDISSCCDQPLRYGLFCAIPGPRHLDAAKELDGINIITRRSARSGKKVRHQMTYFCNRKAKTITVPIQNLDFVFLNY